MMRKNLAGAGFRRPFLRLDYIGFPLKNLPDIPDINLEYVYSLTYGKALLTGQNPVNPEIVKSLFFILSVPNFH
jgi:hypothetical protein